MTRLDGGFIPLFSSHYVHVLNDRTRFGVGAFSISGAGTIWDYSESLSVAFNFEFADLGSSRVRSPVVRGNYDRSQLFFFGVMLNWKNLPWEDWGRPPQSGVLIPPTESEEPHRSGSRQADPAPCQYSTLLMIQPQRFREFTGAKDPRYMRLRSPRRRPPATGRGIAMPAGLEGVEEIGSVSGS